MQQEAEGITSSDTPEVPTVGNSGNYSKAEPQMSCGDSQQTDPKTSYGLDKAVPDCEKTLNNEAGLCSTGDERMASFHIGEQCLTGIIPQRTITYELSQVRHKSATFPSDTKKRSPVDGPTHLPVRPKSPDYVLPSVARAASPTEVFKPMDTIDSLYSAPWGSTYDQDTSLWLPDVSITPLDRICSFEYLHTTKPKPLCVSSLGNVDHTCSAVCEDDPTCVTYHTMADTIASEMPVNTDKGRLSSAIKPVNQERPILPSVNRVSPPKVPSVAVNVKSPQNKKRPPYSVNLALFTAFKMGVSPVIFHRAGIKAIIKHNSRKVKESTDHDTNRHDRDGYFIPIYVPKRCTTVSALSTVLQTSTAVIFGKTAFKYVKNGEKGSDKSQTTTNRDLKVNMNDTVKPRNQSTCSLGTPQRNLNNDTQKHCSSLAVTQQPDIPLSALTHIPVTTNVPNHGENPETKEIAISVAVKPVVGSMMSLAARRHDNSTYMALSSLLVTTTTVVLGDAMENSCVELTEIELSEKVPEVETKVNNRRSVLDILFCVSMYTEYRE
ncbi:hypothetical protein KP79_PYT02893 [Mizuhopecten yessoensis]|uniref:Uncharacterized protein n=1 Tax=Mizuhopecten yessoensis TaxID=6573 RepID=A0A210PK35_MIZYE|nr:hypothetical protein KP79_PYT02893 [Mizuhopecten yessoensis]